MNSGDDRDNKLLYRYVINVVIFTSIVNVIAMHDYRYHYRLRYRYRYHYHFLQRYRYRSHFRYCYRYH